MCPPGLFFTNGGARYLARTFIDAISNVDGCSGTLRNLLLVTENGLAFFKAALKRQRDSKKLRHWNAEDLLANIRTYIQKQSSFRNRK